MVSSFGRSGPPRLRPTSGGSFIEVTDVIDLRGLGVKSDVTHHPPGVGLTTGRGPSSSGQFYRLGQAGGRGGDGVRQESGLGGRAGCHRVRPVREGWDVRSTSLGPRVSVPASDRVEGGPDPGLDGGNPE